MKQRLRREPEVLLMLNMNDEYGHLAGACAAEFYHRSTSEADLTMESGGIIADGDDEDFERVSVLSPPGGRVLRIGGIAYRHHGIAHGVGNNCWNAYWISLKDASAIARQLLALRWLVDQWMHDTELLTNHELNDASHEPLSPSIQRAAT